MNRGNQILIGVLVLQIVLAVVFFWPRQPATEAGQPLFPELETDQVEQVTITDGAGERVELSRSGSGWVLADAGNYPVLDGVVEEFLGKIAALKTGSPVAQTRDSHARLKVSEDDYAFQVVLRMQDRSLRTLYVGSSPSYGTAHVRVANQNEVYLASDLSSADVSTQLSGWIDTTYFSLGEQEVVGLTLSNENGTFEFVTQETAWTMDGLGEGEVASDSVIAALVSSATTIRMVRPLGIEERASYGMHAPKAVLTIRAQSTEGTQSTYTLQVGAQNEQDGSYVLKASESPYYVEVAEYTVTNWLDKTRDDFLEQPEAE
jgi:hypothetical protein